MACNREITDVSSWDGTICATDFPVAARTFAHSWKEHNQSYPSWSWLPCPKQTSISPVREEGYLSLEKICVSGTSKVDHDEGDHPREETMFDCSDEEEAVDNAILVQINQNETHYYDFHIVYSASYRVPVLYFRGYRSDGQPFQLDQIERDLPACSAAVLLESKWTFITLEEHPYLNRPWYKLHPCGTSDWIKLLFQSDDSLAKHRIPVELYLVSWFSVVGPVVGLKVPLEMQKEIQKETQKETMSV